LMQSCKQAADTRVAICGGRLHGRASRSGIRSAYGARHRGRARRVKAIIPRAVGTAGGRITGSRAADAPVRDRRRAGMCMAGRADAFTHLRRPSGQQFRPNQPFIPACQVPDRASRTAHQRGPMICLIPPRSDCLASFQVIDVVEQFLGNGVTVAQQTLTLFVLVRIQVPQPHYCSQLFVFDRRRPISPEKTMAL
jgi:hypothetical protein